MAAEPAERLGRALRDRGETLAVAETCTGGRVAGRVTAVPGASDYLDRAFVPYSYDSLRETLGIERETLDEHGVVSAPVTRDLARRARDLAGATWGVSTTGIAGPGGATPELPVGTVFVGVAHAAPWGSGDSGATAERHDLDGDREAVMDAAATAALEALVGAASDND